MTVWTFHDLELLRRHAAELLALSDLESNQQTTEHLAEVQRAHAAEHNLGLDAGPDPTYDPGHDSHRDQGVEAGV